MPPWLMNAFAALGAVVVRLTQAMGQLAAASAKVARNSGQAAASATVKGGAYVSSELASNNFLQRRASWAAYHTATGGMEALQAGVIRSFTTGSSDLGSRAVTTSVLQQLNDKLGVNFGRIAQTTSAAQATGDMTAQIAEVGGVVTDAERQAYFQFQVAAKNRAHEERRAVQNLLEAQYSKDTTTFNEDSLGSTGRATLNVLTEILNAIKSLGAGK